MTPSKAITLILFCLALIADCILIISNHEEYRIYSKTLLAPLLLIDIDLESANTKHKRSKILINFAFFFFCAGDYLLLDNTNFILGIACFLVAHIFFIAFFLRLKSFSARNRIFTFIMMLVIIAYISILLFYLWIKISRQTLELPVILYSLILGFMLLTAINTVHSKSKKRIALNYFIPGTALFLISDSILAVINFEKPFLYGAVIVMVTYAASLLLLSRGVIRFLK